MGSYRAAVSARFSMFTHTSGYDLTYWVACDLNSTFDIRETAALREHGAVATLAPKTRQRRF